MFTHKKLIVVIILVSLVAMILPNHPLYKVPNAKAETIVKHWTFSDAPYGLSYDATEYQDASFVIVEKDRYGNTRTIRGHAYIYTANGIDDPPGMIKGHRYAKAAVNSNTRAYWNAVRSDHRKEEINNMINDAISIGLFIVGSVLSGGGGVVATFIKRCINAAISITAHSAARVYFANHRQLTPDTVKIVYEMACASDCALDLAHNRNVIVPSWKKSRK